MDWLHRYADELGVPRLTDAEVARLLDLARDVAHGTERRSAPLSTFLAGIAVGASGGGRDVALDRAVAAAEQLLDAAARPTEDRGPSAHRVDTASGDA
ncbi:MAG: molybdopterin-guanine dinucleotide biosynthesis protein MobA [Actinobacteria bacterium]|nr:molybdopterin-guanine dinucleotide biosynthesis protein MobA [Actinomycetota bacterium]